MLDRGLVAIGWTLLTALFTAEHGGAQNRAGMRAAAVKAALIYKMSGYITPAPSSKPATKKPDTKPATPRGDSAPAKPSPGSRDASPNAESTTSSNSKRSTDQTDQTRHARVATREFEIGLVGDDNVTKVAQKVLRGKKQGKLPVALHSLTAKQANAAAATKPCRVLFLAGSLTDDEVRAIIASYATTTTLLISERKGFAHLGGGVQLFRTGKSIRFEINRSALKKQGFRVPSQVMKLSRKGPRS